jgi:ribosomal protein L32
MDPVTVTCEECGQAAIVHRVRYKYVEDGPATFADRHVLREIQREIECPACGMRTQSEQYQPD